MIVERIEKWLLDENAKRGLYQPAKNNASSLGGPCIRELVLARTHPELAKAHEPSTLAIFKLGNEFESITYRWLAESGQQVDLAQLATRDEATDISGKIDGKITVDNVGYIIEIKSSSPFVFAKIKDAASMVTDYDELASLLENNADLEPWFQKQPLFVFKYISQLVTYLYLNAHENGLLIIINKANAQINEVEVKLYDWLNLAEALLRRSRAITGYVNRKELPDGANLINHCPKYCNFYNCSECKPILGFNDSFTVINPGDGPRNKEFCQIVDDICANDDIGKEFNSNKKKLAKLATMSEGKDEHTLIIHTESGATHEIHMKRRSDGVIVRTLRSEYKE